MSTTIPARDVRKGDITATTSILTVSCHMDLTDAPEVEDIDSGDRFTPTLAVWNASLYSCHTAGDWYTSVTLREGYDDGRSAPFYSTPPAWLPAPPDGWDLGVRIEAERRAIDAEAGQ